MGFKTSNSRAGARNPRSDAWATSVSTSPATSASAVLARPKNSETCHYRPPVRLERPVATTSASEGPDQIPDGWNATAESYDGNAWELMTPYVAEAIRLAELAPHHELLDVAAGSGRVTVEVAPLVRRVLSTDFAAGMLQVLRGRANRGGFANVEVAQMDGQNLNDLHRVLRSRISGI